MFAKKPTIPPVTVAAIAPPTLAPVALDTHASALEEKVKLPGARKGLPQHANPSRELKALVASLLTRDANHKA